MKNNQTIALFGAGGFLGRHLLRELTKNEYRVKVGTRNPHVKNYLKMGNPGQIDGFSQNGLSKAWTPRKIHGFKSK